MSIFLHDWEECPYTNQSLKYKLQKLSMCGRREQNIPFWNKALPECFIRNDHDGIQVFGIIAPPKTRLHLSWPDRKYFISCSSADILILFRNECVANAKLTNNNLWFIICLIQLPTMSDRGKKRGRPATVTDSTKKKRVASASRKFREAKTRLEIWLYDRDKETWEEMKRENNITTNLVGFRFLLDL